MQLPDADKTAVQFHSANLLSLDDLVVALNRCVEGYLFPIRFDHQSIFFMARVDSLDLSASVVARCGGKVAGVALVARRGWNCRLASMSIDPELRGRRIGTRLVGHMLRVARERGDRSFSLETIEQNVPALRLYQAAGFNRVRRLLGYSADAIAGKDDSGMEETDPIAVGMAVSKWGLPDLPWQVASQTLMALVPPCRAFRLGPAAAIITDPAGETVTLRAVVVETQDRRQRWATRLVQALSARFPGKRWKVSLLAPEEIPFSFFAQLNFRKEELTQLQMSRLL